MRKRAKFPFAAAVCALALAGCGTSGDAGKGQAAENMPEPGASQTAAEGSTGQESGLEDLTEVVSDAFEQKGYSVQCEAVGQQILSGSRYRIVLDGDLDRQIVLYAYDSPEEAEKDAANIEADGEFVIVTDGDTATRTHIEWTGIPHYYLLDNLLVQYVGTDEEILTILVNLCGEQFAGGKENTASENTPPGGEEEPGASLTAEQIEDAKQAALAYYEGTVFSVNTIEYTEKLPYGDTAEGCSFIVNVSRGGVVQEPDRGITLQFDHGSWEVVNEGY